MSVIVYGPEGEKLIDPNDLHAYLKQGYRIDKFEVEEELTDDEVRTKARQLGIKSWHNKGIDKLKREINAT